MQYGTLYVQQKAKVANEYVGVTARPISCMFNEQRKPFGSDVLRFLINKLPASPPSTSKTIPNFSKEFIAIPQTLEKWCHEVQMCCNWNPPPPPHLS